MGSKVHAGLTVAEDAGWVVSVAAVRVSTLAAREDDDDEEAVVELLPNTPPRRPALVVSRRSTPSKTPLLVVEIAGALDDLVVEIVGVEALPSLELVDVVFASFSDDVAGVDTTVGLSAWAHKPTAQDSHASGPFIDYMRMNYH